MNEYNKCNCCKHDIYKYCPICKKKRTVVLECLICGESLITKQIGLTRRFGDTDEVWQDKLAKHKIEVLRE